MSKVQNILFIKINHVQGLSKYISVTNLIGTIWVAAGGGWRVFSGNCKILHKGAYS